MNNEFEEQVGIDELQIQHDSGYEEGYEEGYNEGYNDANNSILQKIDGKLGCITFILLIPIICTGILIIVMIGTGISIFDLLT